MDQICNKFHSSLKVISAGRINLLPRMLELKKIESADFSSAYLTIPLIVSMASAWPHLTSLKLSSHLHADQYETSSLQTLLLIASSFPHLNTLHFFYALPGLPGISEIPFTSHGLVSLSLISRCALDPHPVALLLDKVFPTLRNVSVRGPLASSSDLHDWHDVAIHIRKAQANRTANQNNSVKTVLPFSGAGAFTR